MKQFTYMKNGNRQTFYFDGEVYFYEFNDEGKIELEEHEVPDNVKDELK